MSLDAQKAYDSVDHVYISNTLKAYGFPDNFIFPVSEIQAMKQLGNSVAVHAIQEVASATIKYIELKTPIQKNKDDHTLFQRYNEWAINEQKI